MRGLRYNGGDGYDSGVSFGFSAGDNGVYPGF